MIITNTVEELSQIHRLGRTIVKDGYVSLFWPGSGLEFNFQGTFLSFRYQADYDSLEPWISILIDGEWIQRIQTNRGLFDVNIILNGNIDEVHRITILKDTQPMGSDQKHKLQIISLMYDGEITSQEPYSMKIEFIGDSITSGEGTVGDITDMDWIPKNFSFVPTYEKVTADKLNADYRVISQSGWGIHSSWNNNIYETLPSVYDEVCSLSENGNVPYNFSEWQADVVVINLGTNDEGAFHQPPYIHPETGEEFQHRLRKDGTYHPEDVEDIIKAQVRFLANIRKHYPNAMLIWCYGMIGHSFSEVLEKGVNKFIDEYEDKNTFYLELPEMTEETVGSRNHPGPSCHEEAGNVLAEFIQSNPGDILESSEKEVSHMQKQTSRLNALFIQMNVVSFGIVFVLMFVATLVLSVIGKQQILGLFLKPNFFLHLYLILYYTILISFLLRNTKKNNINWKNLCEFKMVRISSIPLLILLGFITRFAANYIIDLMDFVFIIPRTLHKFSWFPFIVVGIIGPVCEEIIMRGFFFQRYKLYISTRKAILVSAFLFGILHLNFIQFGFTIVDGIWFALAIEATGSIYSAMLLHIIHNIYIELNVGFMIQRLPFIREFNNYFYQFAHSIGKISASVLVLRTVIFVINCIAAFFILKILAKREGLSERFAHVFSRNAGEPEKKEVVVLDVWMIILIVISFLIMFFLTRSLFTLISKG